MLCFDTIDTSFFIGFVVVVVVVVVATAAVVGVEIAVLVLIPQINLSQLQKC